MTTFRKKIGIPGYYDALVLAYRALFRIAGNALRPRIDPKFAERLMLAVTEVNGCEACSYAHTLTALRKGFSKEEIDSFLNASGAYVVPEEAQGIFFAQHYADSGGRPDRQAYEALVRGYGAAKSKVIVAAIQVMMAGNMMGIPISAFLARLRGRPYQGSSLLYELGMQLSGLVLVPVSAVHAFLRWISLRGSIRFRGPDHPRVSGQRARASFSP
jgi:AhpD family alkylhydroperoxidase